MSQHDMNTADALFPDFRSDLNNALVALVSLSSGATAPSTTFPNMLWYDTANNILKMRNEDDDAWISLLTLDQTNDIVSQLFGGKLIVNSAGKVFIGASTPAAGGAGNANTSTDGIRALDMAHGSATAGEDISIMTFSGIANPSSGSYFIFNDSVGTNGSIGPNGSGGVAFNTTSDRSLKEKIRDLEDEEDPIELVKSIRVRKFRLKENGAEAVGVVHDELEAVYPQACSRNRAGLGLIDRSELAIPALAAAKKLAAMVETLEARVAQLETELARRP